MSQGFDKVDTIEVRTKWLIDWLIVVAVCTQEDGKILSAKYGNEYEKWYGAFSC